jgi:hypothetical protein
MPDCDGVGKSTSHFARVAQTIDAFLVDNLCAVTSLAAAFVEDFGQRRAYKSYTVVNDKKHTKNPFTILTCDFSEV